MSRVSDVLSKNLFRNIYGNDPGQNPNDSIISKIKEQVKALSGCSKAELHKFYFLLNKRIVFLKREHSNCYGNEEFLRQNEWASLVALNALRPLIHPKGTHRIELNSSGIHLSLKWKQLILKKIGLDRSNKLETAFVHFYAAQWSKRFSKLEKEASVELQELVELHERLTLPTQEQFLSYYLKLEEMIEEGVEGPDEMGFQTLDDGEFIAFDSRPINLISEGRSSLIYRCSVKQDRNMNHPCYPKTATFYGSGECVLKLGRGIYRSTVYTEFKNLKKVHAHVKGEDKQAIIPLLSSYYRHIESKSISSENIQVVRSNSTEYHNLLDGANLSVGQKEQLALGYIAALQRVYQLGYFPSYISPQCLSYKKQGGSFELYFSHPCQFEKVPEANADILFQGTNHALGTTLYMFLSGGEDIQTQGYSKKLIDQLSAILSFQPVKMGPLPKKVNLLESDAFEGVFLPLYNRGNLITPHKSFGNLAWKQKREIALDLLSSLAAYMKNDFVLCDLRWENLLVSFENKQYHSTICDLEQMVSFKHLRLLDPAKFEELRQRFRSWTPNDLPAPEFISILCQISSIQLNNRREAQSALERIQDQINRMEMFIIGMALCDLFLGQLPYKRVPWSESNPSPLPVFEGDSYQCFVLTDNFYNENYKNALKKRAMDSMGEFLFRMVHPDPFKRPSLYEFTRFLNQSFQ